MEQEKAVLTKQKAELVQQLKIQLAMEPQVTQTSPIPDILLNKIKELNNSLVDNKRFMDLIQKISEEKRNLESELLALKGQKSSNVPFGDLIARVSVIIENEWGRDVQKLFFRAITCLLRI